MANEKEKKEKGLTEDQKDKDFVKIFRGHLDDITNLARENSKAYDLFMLLLKHMDGTNALCVSRMALSELLNCSEKTITRAIKYLKEHGWVCVLKSGSSNVYIVNPRVAWTSYANQREYCRFNANVLLTSSENNTFLKNKDATNHFKTIDTDFIKAVQEKKREYEEKNKYFDEMNKQGA